MSEPGHRVGAIPLPHYHGIGEPAPHGNTEGHGRRQSVGDNHRTGVEVAGAGARDAARGLLLLLVATSTSSSSSVCIE